MSLSPAVSKPEKALLLVSGGPKSAALSQLLHAQKLPVLGFHVSVFAAGSVRKKLEELEHRLHIPIYEDNAEEEFQERVIDTIVHRSIHSGTLDVRYAFHREILINRALRYANKHKISHIYTAHSVHLDVDPITKSVTLKAPHATHADQSRYFGGLSADLLLKIQAPFGTMTKALVDRFVDQFSLSDMTGFDLEAQPLFDFMTMREWIKDHLPPEYSGKGMVQATEGNTVGEHEGLNRFQIGQSLGRDPNPDRRVQLEKPEEYVVVGFDVPRGNLIIGQEPQLESSQYFLRDWTQSDPRSSLLPRKTTVRLHDRDDELDADLSIFGYQSALLKLHHPARAVLYGTRITVYEKGEWFGSGVIEKVIS